MNLLKKKNLVIFEEKKSIFKKARAVSVIFFFGSFNIPSSYMLYVEPNREPHLPCRFFEYIYLFQLRSSEPDDSKDSDSCDSDSYDTTVTVIVLTLLTLTKITLNSKSCIFAHKKGLV